MKVRLVEVSTSWQKVRLIEVSTSWPNHSTIRYFRMHFLFNHLSILFNQIHYVKIKTFNLHFKAESTRNEINRLQKLIGKKLR